MQGSAEISSIFNKHGSDDKFLKPTQTQVCSLEGQHTPRPPLLTRKLFHEYHVSRFLFLFLPFSLFSVCDLPSASHMVNTETKTRVELQRVLPSSYACTSRRIWTPLTTDLSPFARPHAQIHIPTTHSHSKRDYLLGE